MKLDGRIWKVKFKIIGFVLLLIAIPLVLSSFPRIGENILNPLAQEIKILKAEDRLSKIASEEILGGEGRYAIAIKNLKTGESFFYNESKKFDSASLYKLWVMAVSFQKIKDGTLREDEILTLPVSYLEETLSTTIPTPTPEGAPTATPTPPEEEKKISMEVSIAIEKMITVSDNYAALLLASRSGTPSIVSFLKQYELTDSNFRQPPQTTARDVLIFFEKLYKGDIVDEDYSERMTDILKQQTLNDRIPKYLPVDIEVAHKTGELFGFKHDAGIVFGKKGDYIIVVLSETKNPIATAERIAKFSKKVFDYFEGN
ncbi:MAG: Beta-lactamase [Candidatus Levybacteria bacterium GW2011_GWA2_40_8]|nr:MAG: Beta-lactamase [Candidatus Levybacteria bacterium GW2011_GWA2_40_8]